MSSINPNITLSPLSSLYNVEELADTTLDRSLLKTSKLYTQFIQLHKERSKESVIEEFNRQASVVLNQEVEKFPWLFPVLYQSKKIEEVVDKIFNLTPELISCKNNNLDAENLYAGAVIAKFLGHFTEKFDEAIKTRMTSSLSPPLLTNC